MTLELEDTAPPMPAKPAAGAAAAVAPSLAAASALAVSAVAAPGAASRRAGDVGREASALAFTETLAGPPRAPARGGESLGPGRQLAHYRIERLLGTGGMGEVYLATDLALDRPVALKVLAHGTSTPARRDRLVREARAQARIQHANVCHIYYIGESEGLLFFAMELVVGKTFAERLTEGPLAPDEALELVRKAALGLREATRCGFTHRDVKPSNLMLDQHGEVKVMDFGLVAGSLDRDESPGGSVEQTSMAGTPLYMAPEQARGEAIDFRADIYALGATLYHLVAGKPPFAGDTAAELLSLHSTAERPPLARSGLSARALQPVQGLCARMMARDPAQRHGSYDELIRDIELLSSVHSRPAGATVRFVAAQVDFSITIPLLVGLSSLGQTVLPGWQLDSVAAFTLLHVALRVLFLSWLGRSLGQAVFELEVVSMRDGKKPSRRQALERTLWQLGLPLLGLPLSALTAVVPGLGSFTDVFALAAFALLVAHLYFASMRRAKRRTLWDRRSDTMVRYRRR